MSNYVKSTNFATKDSLSAGDVNKIVKGTEIDTEFNNIATAISTKADTASPTFTGTVTLPSGAVGVTQSYGDNDTSLATTAFVQAALQALYPVGSIYTNATNATNPATLFGFGTWTAFGAGRVPVGFDSTNALFDAAEETGGSADAIIVSHTHTATVTDAGHSHQVDSGNQRTLQTGGVGLSDDGTATANATGTSTTGISVAISTTGSSGTNANYQPYITVYMWKRTA
mgnify:FL=1|jgi:hypothetical protein